MGGSGVHSHIQGTVGLKAKSSLGRIELMRRDAQIENGAVVAFGGVQNQEVLSTGKGRVVHGKARFVDEYLLSSLNRLYVPVKCDQFSLISQFV